MTHEEYNVLVPMQYRAPSGEPMIVIGISAHGGGTVGEAYADNGWDYSVTVDGEQMITGSDLRSNGTPGTHHGMAKVLASFLANDGEILHDKNGVLNEELSAHYSPEQMAFLIDAYERFSMFSMDEPCSCHEDPCPIRVEGDPKWIPHVAEMRADGTCAVCGAEAGNPEHCTHAVPAQES